MPRAKVCSCFQSQAIATESHPPQFMHTYLQLMTSANSRILCATVTSALASNVVHLVSRVERQSRFLFKFRQTLNPLQMESGITSCTAE